MLLVTLTHLAKGEDLPDLSKRFASGLAYAPRPTPGTARRRATPEFLGDARQASSRVRKTPDRRETELDLLGKKDEVRPP